LNDIKTNASPATGEDIKQPEHADVLLRNSLLTGGHQPLVFQMKQ